jgi:hypothetical protein
LHFTILWNTKSRAIFLPYPYVDILANFMYSLISLFRITRLRSGFKLQERGLKMELLRRKTSRRSLADSRYRQWRLGGLQADMVPRPNRGPFWEIEELLPYLAQSEGLDFASDGTAFLLPSRPARKTRPTKSPRLAKPRPRDPRTRFCWAAFFGSSSGLKKKRPYWMIGLGNQYGAASPRQARAKVFGQVQGKGCDVI